MANATFYSSPFSPFRVPSLALAAESAIEEEKSPDTGLLNLRQIGGPITARSDAGSNSLETARRGAWISSDAGKIRLELNPGLKNSLRTDTPSPSQP